MKVVSLFSGGGLGDLGFVMAGCEIVAQVEIDEYCHKILALRYPDAKKFRDIRTVKGSDLPECDIITGGFPCQDISTAGRKAGITGSRSGLWGEFYRIIREVRPRYVVVENSPNLLRLGIGVVLGNLASIGYDSEWDCIPANCFNAPHKRNRLWVISYPNSMRESQPKRLFKNVRGRTINLREKVCDATSERLPNWTGGKVGQPKPLTEPKRSNGEREIEYDFCGVGHGVTNRVQRLKLLGNGQVPYCTKWIAERIIEYEADRS